MNNKNDRHNATNLNISMPKYEVNTGCAEIEIAEFSYKGITLKGLHAHANVTVTDEKVRVETDACMKLFSQFLGEFAPSIIKLIEAEAENTKVRRAWYEAQTNECEAHTKECDARTAKYEAEAKAAGKKAEDAQL